MPYQHLEPISKQLTIVIGLTVVGFMAFGLALSFYRNILFEQTLNDIELQNRKIAKSIDQGYRDLEYYRSDQYKDKYAKENLGKVNPGEKVLILTQRTQMPSDVPEDELTITERQEAAYFELLQQMPVWEHWKIFLFYRDRVDKLKRGL